MRYILFFSFLFSFLFSLTFNIRADYTITVDSSKNYQSLDESSSQIKLISDKFGNYYLAFVKRFNRYDNIFVYASYDNGYSWTTLNPQGPIAVIYHDQKFPTLTIDDKNGIIYCFWVGADDNHTGTFYFKKYDKQQEGDTQLKFAYYKNGKWSDWRNIAEVPGYSEWVKNPLINSEQVLTNNPVIGGKLQSVKYYQMYPSAAVDSLGNVYVVWCGPDPDFVGYQIKFVKSTDFGKTWSKWKNLTTVAESNNRFFAQIRPKILIDKNDRIWIFYEGQDSSDIWGSGKQYQKIKYIYSDDRGVTFSTPAEITTDAKIEKYIDAIVDSNNKIHLVWSGQFTGTPESDMRQIRYGTIFGGVPAPKNYYISATTNYEQKYPSITLDENDVPIVIWSGNDAAHPVYEDGDPNTENIDVAHNWTGLYLYKSKYNPANDSWTDYEVLGKGYQASFLESDRGKYVVWAYLLAAGRDDFRLQFTIDNEYLNSLWEKSNPDSENKDKLYILPQPASFEKNENVVLQYEVSQNNSNVEIGIVNISGEKIAILVNGNRDKGIYQIYWNGRIGDYSAYSGNYIGNSDNEKISRGVYIIYYKVGDTKIMKKFFVK